MRKDANNGLRGEVGIAAQLFRNHLTWYDVLRAVPKIVNLFAPHDRALHEFHRHFLPIGNAEPSIQFCSPLSSVVHDYKF